MPGPHPCATPCRDSPRDPPATPCVRIGYNGRVTPTPRRRNIAPPREDVLAAVMATVAGRGLDGLTMAGLGREVGMSSGHLLYYFRTKDELLLQTLEWSEARLGAERRALLAAPAPCASGSTPTSRCTSPTATATRTGRSGWRSGTARRTPTTTPAPGRPPSRTPGTATWWSCWPTASRAASSGRGHRPAATRLRALMDGFSVHVAVGIPGTGRDQVLEQLRDVRGRDRSHPTVGPAPRRTSRPHPETGRDPGARCARLLPCPRSP